MIQEFFYNSKTAKKSGGIFIGHTSADHSPNLSETDNMMLIYAAHGKGLFFINNSDVNVNEGDIFLIAPNTKNSLIAALPDTHLSIYCCVFTPDVLPYAFKKYKGNFPELSDFFDGKTPFISLCDAGNKIIRNYMIKMIDDYSYSQPASEYSVKCILNAVLIDVFRIFCANQNKKDSFNTNMTMGVLINYINQNIYSKISLSQTADMLHLSPSYLCRFFKKNTDMTFTEFVNKMRVETIKDELEHTDRPIFMIYGDFEFTSQHINHIFKKYTGYSLAEYKEKFNYKTNNPLFNI